MGGIHNSSGTTLTAKWIICYGCNTVNKTIGAAKIAYYTYTLPVAMSYKLYVGGFAGYSTQLIGLDGGDSSAVQVTQIKYLQYNVNDKQSTVSDRRWFFVIGYDFS